MATNLITLYWYIFLSRVTKQDLHLVYAYNYNHLCSSVWRVSYKPNSQQTFACTFHATYLSCECKDGAKYILVIPGIVSILQKNSSHFCPAKSYYVSTKMTRYGETEITCEILNNLRYAGTTRLATLLEALFWAANSSAVNDIITYFIRVVRKRLKQRNFSRIKCLRVWCM